MEMVERKTDLVNLLITPFSKEYSEKVESEAPRLSCKGGTGHVLVKGIGGSWTL